MIKLQHMTIIFIIVMLPIILVLSYYISTQIDTINLQVQYDTKLNDATHDAMEAFQINTRNNEYSTIADSNKRDVQAAVNTFYTSLAANIGMMGYTKAELQPYIPAILCTMYDGYYISSPTKAEVSDLANDPEKVDLLKQYTYYTANYINGENNLIINYSLDSYISIYGKINGQTVARSGYLIQYGDQGLTEINGVDLTHYAVYNPSTDAWIRNVSSPSGYIKDGAIWTGDDCTAQVEIDSITYNGETIQPENRIVVKNIERQYEEKAKSKEALYYYIEAYEFSKYVTEGLQLANVVDSDPEVRINSRTIYRNGVADNQIANPSGIFDLRNQNPENLQSAFVNHKRDIIRLTIEDSLQTAFNNFEGIATYDYQFPKLSDTEWEKIYKNVSFVTFMQGMQVGSKIYNNYSVVTSTGNEKYVDPEEIYFIERNQYHRITCDQMTTPICGYRSNIYLPQSKIVGPDNADLTGSGYILKEIGTPQELYACYHCMIDANYTSIYDEDGKLGEGIEDSKKQAYYKALARERYCLKSARATTILNASLLKTRVELK